VIKIRQVLSLIYHADIDEESG